MKVLRRILPAALLLFGAIVGAILASKKATKLERKSNDRALRSAELAHDNQLDAAAAEADRAWQFQLAAAAHKAKAQKRIEEVADHDPTLAGVIAAYNRGVRDRTGDGTESLGG